MTSGLAPMGVLIVLALGACAVEDPGRQDPVGPSGESQLSNPTARRTGALGSTVDASCVEEYSPAAVANRAFAFDGVVIDIAGSVSDRGGEGDLGLPGVTFRVNQWFSDGEGRTVKVDLQVAEDSFDIGSRLLVSGESRWGEADLADAIAWGCGFTRYHDAETAREWQQAF